MTRRMLRLSQISITMSKLTNIVLNRLFFILFNYFLRTCHNVWTFHCFHNILREFVNKACYDGSLS